MKTLKALFILLTIFVSSAQATVDPDPDGIGVYFDAEADIHEIVVPVSVPFFAYVILTNPSAPEIMGYEFSATRAIPAGMETMVFVLDEIWHGYNEILPVEPPEQGGNFMIGWGTPEPTSPATILVTWQIMLLAPLVMDFHIGPSTGDFGTNGQLTYDTPTGPVSMHVSSGAPALPVATVNGSGIVPASSTSFGSLKALFR